MPGEWVTNYLRSSRDRYSRETLVTVLLAGGHSRAEIDEALADLELEGTAPSSSRQRRRPVQVLHGMVLGVAYVAALFGAAVLASAVTADSSIGRVTVAVGATCGLAGWLYARRRDRAIASGLLAGLVLALLIPTLLYLAVLGLPFVKVSKGG
jgi:hypothetical protein